MQRAPDHFWHDVMAPSSGLNRKLREAFWLFADAAKLARFGVEDPSDSQRQALCRSLAQVLRALHANEAVYGDVSARNILWTTRPVPSVFLLDCDGVRRVGSAAPLRRQLDSPDWGDPSFTSNQTLESDRYKYGLFVARTFSRDLTSREIGPAARALGDDARTMLGRALSDSAPGTRPTMDEWLSFFTTGVATRRAPSDAPAPATEARADTMPDSDRWLKGSDGRWRRSSGSTAPAQPAPAATPKSATAERWVYRGGKWVRLSTNQAD
jgi:hypothetical protein